MAMSLPVKVCGCRCGLLFFFGGGGGGGGLVVVYVGM